MLLGGYGGFEKMMKTLVGVMGFSILVCAALTFHDPAGVLRGTLRADDSIRRGSVRAVDHRRHRRLGDDAVVQLLDARREAQPGPSKLGYVRGDIAIAYLFTALFGMAIMMTANQAFYVPGVAITNAQAVPKMAEMLGSILGTFGRCAYSVGFWAAVFASLLGVWQSVPYLYADFYSILKKLPPDERERVTKVTSTPYRLALMFVTLAPIPFAFTGQPSRSSSPTRSSGSVFVPFLAATLLYLNNRVSGRAPFRKTIWATNALLPSSCAVCDRSGETRRGARLG